MEKYSKKLVSKCIYIQILKSTETELLSDFMGNGGWALTHYWLQDAINTKNWPLVQEILELLLLCQVDIERLKSNSAPKLVKLLTKEELDSVRILAVKLVDQWLRVVRGETVQIVRPVENEENEQVNEQPKPAVVEIDKAPVQEKEKLIFKINVKDQVVTKKQDEEEQPPTDMAEEEVSIEIRTEDMTDSNVGEEIQTSDSTKLKKSTTVVQEEANKKVEDESKKEPKKKDKSDKERHKTSKSSSSKHQSSSGSSKSSSSSTSKNKTSGSTSSSSSRDKERDKHRSSSSSKSKSKSGSSSSKSSKEKKEKIEEVPQSVVNAKALLETSSVVKLGKIPKKKSTTEDDAAKVAAKPAAAVTTLNKVKPTFSIEERDPEKRAKTVKTFNSKFRSHGLEGFEAPQTAAKKELTKKPSTEKIPATTTTTTTTSPPTAIRRSSPTLSPIPEKKMKLLDEPISPPLNGLKLSSKPKRKYRIAFNANGALFFSLPNR